MSADRHAERGLVTVLLPCYNAQAFLRPALDSVLGQTYANLEILAVDDGSKDDTAQILAACAARDPRIRLEPNDRNRGLIYTLNRGVELASGSLIARMDADDIAMPERIAAQVRYFSEHPETEVLSSDYAYVGVQGQLLFNPAPYRFTARTLRFLMFFVNPLCHPTVMGRRKTFVDHPYSTRAVHSEDFELWHRMLDEGVIIRNLPERLLRFRANTASVSHRHEQEQVSVFMRTSAAAIERYFGLHVSFEVHRILMNRMLHGGARGADLKLSLKLFRDMKREYIRREGLDAADEALIEEFANRHLLKIFLHSYKRSSQEDSARGLAAREAALMTLRNPRPTCLLAVERTRERIAR